MKKQVNPAVIAVVLAVVVVGVVFFLFHAATDKPAYPGLNAGRPADETATRNDKPTTPAQAQKMHIPGMNPNPPGAQPANPPGQ